MLELQNRMLSQAGYAVHVVDHAQKALQWIREDHPVEPDSPYGASKLGAEKLCLAYAKLCPLECVCLRYFNVYGVNQRYDDYGNVIPIFAHRALRGQPLVIYGYGEQTRDFVNVRDVAMANYRAGLSRGVQGALLVVHDEPEVAVRVRLLATPLRQGDELISHVDEGHSPGSTA